MKSRCTLSGAFTLIEVLVAVVLLAAMVLIVSNVLSQGSQVAMVAETRIRQNNAASALAEAIRDHLRRASKDGVFCITQDALGRPRMILTTVGVSTSLTGSARSAAAFALLGMVDNQAFPADTNARILWMPSYVLTELGGSGSDVWACDFARLQSYTRKGLHDNVLNSFVGIVNNLRVPPSTIADVGLLWQVGASGISALSIQWSDGARDVGGNLLWYGVDVSGSVAAKNAGWAGLSSVNLDSTSLPEYNAGGAPPAYRALWTHHNQNLWPRAVKIRFTLRDSAMPPDLRSYDYEVIGTVGQ